VQKIQEVPSVQENTRKHKLQSNKNTRNTYIHKSYKIQLKKHNTIEIINTNIYKKYKEMKYMDK